MKLLTLEFSKLKRRKILLTIFLLLAAQFIWGLWSAKIHSRHGSGDIWAYLVYFYATINSLFMPILIAVLASRISDLEHKGSTFKMLLTQVSPAKLYSAKFMCCIILAAIASIGQMIMITLTGFMAHSPEAYPAKLILFHGLSTLTASIPITALQLGISMLIANQMFALTAGLAGGFIGIMSMFFETGISKLFLWSYYFHLSAATPKFIDNSSMTVLINYSINIGSIIFVLISGVILYLLGSVYFSKKEC